MANLLTSSEAADILRTTTDDPNMLLLLPQIDAFIRDATGRDWTADSSIHGTAKAAARMLLVMWYENPGMVGNGETLSYGITAALGQLESIAMRRRKAIFYGREGAGAIVVSDLQVGDQVISLVTLYGGSGSAASSFESVVSVNGQIQQTATDDFSERLYQVEVISAADALLP